MCGFTDEKPVILVIGGSLGAVAVNEAVRAALPELLIQSQIIHLCGKGKVDDSLKEIKGYCQFEYIKRGERFLFNRKSRWNILLNKRLRHFFSY